MLAPDGSTTCGGCGRAMWPKDLDTHGKCPDCEQSARITEAEWRDLGRPRDTRHARAGSGSLSVQATTTVPGTGKRKVGASE